MKTPTRSKVFAGNKPAMPKTLEALIEELAHEAGLANTIPAQRVDASISDNPDYSADYRFARILLYRFMRRALRKGLVAAKTKSRKR